MGLPAKQRLRSIGTGLTGSPIDVYKRQVREKAPNTELVLTGRGAPEELIALADYVSVIEARKHPFADGARNAAREGVEY